MEDGLREHLEDETDPVRHMAALVAVGVEEAAAGDGWNQPAALFAVEAIDAPDEMVADLFGDEDPDVTFTWRICADRVLDDGAPFDQLCGHTIDRPDIIGVGLYTEAWSTVSTTRTSPTPVCDRDELRMVSVVLRDGTEAHLVRKRSTGEASFVPVGGRVISALRRTIMLPSGAVWNSTVDDVAARAQVELVCSLTASMTSAGATRQTVVELLDGVVRMGRDTLAQLPGWRSALTATSDWETCHHRAIEVLREQEPPASVPEHVRDALAAEAQAVAWCDTDMFAHLADSWVSDSGLLRQAIGEFVTLGHLPDHIAVRALDLLDH